MQSVTSTDTGKNAEKVVAEHLIKSGYKIIAQNWRTRWCEIDIIAKKNKTVFFVEVKHRKNDHFGDGLDAITGKKLKQMSFAAEMWVAEHNYKSSYSLMAVSTTGSPPKVSAIVDL